MFIRKASMPSLRRGKPKTVSKERGNSVFEQSEEFAKWLEQWERRVQRSRTNPLNPH